MGGADGSRPEAPVRVLLCDDTPEMRTLLRWALEQDDGVEIVAEAVDGPTAARLAAEAAPEVVLLDLDMPGNGPAALLRDVSAAAPHAAIVTFSGHEPDLVAGEAAEVVTLHVPKTTDLPMVRLAVLELGRSRRAL